MRGSLIVCFFTHNFLISSSPALIGAVSGKDWLGDHPAAIGKDYPSKHNQPEMNPDFKLSSYELDKLGSTIKAAQAILDEANADDTDDEDEPNPTASKRPVLTLKKKEELEDIINRRKERIATIYQKYVDNNSQKLRVLAIQNPNMLINFPNLKIYSIPFNDNTPQELPPKNHQIYLTIPSPHENLECPSNIKPFSVGIGGCPFDPATGQVITHQLTINGNGTQKTINAPRFFYSDVSGWYRSDVDQNGKLIWIKI